jgi:hypothetical protein
MVIKVCIPYLEIPPISLRKLLAASLISEPRLAPVMPSMSTWLLQMLLPGKNKDASRLIDWVEHGEFIL